MALTVTSVGHRSSILVLGNDFSDPKREFLRDHVTTFLQLVDVGWFWGALKQIFWICLDQVKSYAWISRVHFIHILVTTPKHQRVAALFLAKSVSLDDHSVVAL